MPDTDRQVFNLSQQFAVASFIILVGGMLVLGWWVSNIIQAAVFRQATEVTSAYIDSFVAPYIYAYLNNGYISPAMSVRFTRELGEANFGHQIVSIKIWDLNGHVLYSNIPGLAGQKFPLSRDLRKASTGEVHAHIAPLDDEEHLYERHYWDRLIEIYAPVYAPGSRDVIAVAEYYLPADDLEQEMRRARQSSWGVVGIATFIMYIVLNTLVARGNAIIQEQAGQLHGQIYVLEGLLEQNRMLHSRIQRAARRTVELNERFLRRVSAELHDGPLQMLAVAALRLDDVVSALDEDDLKPAETEQLESIQGYLQDAMREMRTIAAGLRLPQTAGMSLFEVVEHAVSMHEKRTQTRVQLDVEDLPPDESVATELKIATYRITEEALNNAYKHAGGQGQRVLLRLANCMDTSTATIELLISDRGPGMRTLSPEDARLHLGVISMRERAESLGGTFAIQSEPGQGTTIRVCLPLKLEDENDV